MDAERPIMQENLPVERLVRKALWAGETIGRPGIRQLGIPQGAKRLEEPLIDRPICPDITILRVFSGIFALPCYFQLCYCSGGNCLLLILFSGDRLNTVLLYQLRISRQLPVQENCSGLYYL
jgi:hypothetical protein